MSDALQAGALGVLALLLVLQFRLVLAFLPMARLALQFFVTHDATIEKLSSEVAHNTSAVREMLGRGICPLRAELQRVAEGQRPTEPEVLT